MRVREGRAYWFSKVGQVILETFEKGTPCWKAGEKCKWVLEKFNEQSYKPHKSSESSELRCAACGTKASKFLRIDDRLPLDRGLLVVEGAGSERSCFIATAVYETPSSPEIQTLRKFRDKFLLQYFLGKVIMQVYYSISPRLAAFISKSAFAKRIVRGAIVEPMVKIARIYLQKNRME